MEERRGEGVVVARVAAAAASDSRSVRRPTVGWYIVVDDAFVRRCQQINVPRGNDSPAVRFVDVFVSVCESRKTRVHITAAVMYRVSRGIYDRGALARRPDYGRPNARSTSRPLTALSAGRCFL